MLASDLTIEELLKIDPKKGFPLFGSHRIMVTGIFALRRFGDDLTEGLGFERMGRLLARLGYENGLTAATVIADMYDFDSKKEWFLAGKILMRMAGVVDQEITEWDYDPVQNHVRFKGIWHDSFEAMNFRAQMPEPSPQPICNLLTGLLSGYASGVFGREIFIREITCEAHGESVCAFEGRSVDEHDQDFKTFQDYLTLPTLDEDITRLKSELCQSREALAQREAEIERLKKEAHFQDNSSGIVYRSKPMANLISLADKVAQTDSTVLIQGESGTGKELIARFVHERSNRRHHPFLAINCAALPPNLLETELFGYVKGAFTGADGHKNGLLLEAGSGTFFLDEVSEMPVALQAKLLRMLQEKEIRPVGGTRNIPISVRVIAATNRDLRQVIEKGDFRDDLYYRLSVFPLTLEPLRNRKDDILILARHFLTRLKPDHPGFAPEVVRCLESYPWPGNIRELENTIEYSSILAPDEKITLAHLPPSITPNRRDPLSALTSGKPSLKELEQRYVNLILEHTKGNKAEAARILDIGTTTLWRYLKKE